VQGSIAIKSGNDKQVWMKGHHPDDLALYQHDRVDLKQAQFAIILGEAARRQLNKLGIEDISKHFMGKTVRATGQITRQWYTSPMMTGEHTELIIDDVSNIEVVRK
jgi:hypothetical protein